MQIAFFQTQGFAARVWRQEDPMGEIMRPHVIVRRIRKTQALASAEIIGDTGTDESNRKCDRTHVAPGVHALFPRSHQSDPRPWTVRKTTADELARNRGLAAMRGLMVGVLVGGVIWICIGTLTYFVFR